MLDVIRKFKDIIKDMQGLVLFSANRYVQIGIGIVIGIEGFNFDPDSDPDK